MSFGSSLVFKRPSLAHLETFLRQDIPLCTQIKKVKVKLATVVEGDQKAPFSIATEVLGWALVLSLGCSTLSSTSTLYWWVLSKEVSSTIFKVFGMTQPGIEPRSPRPSANTNFHRLHFLLSINLITDVWCPLFYLLQCRIVKTNNFYDIKIILAKNQFHFIFI